MTTKRLIFTVTTGRSGTMFLSSFLHLLSDVACYHEYNRDFNRHFRLIRENPERQSEFWEKIKFPFINSHKAGTYIETSHFFCKGFFEHLVSEYKIIPDLIILKRDARSVARSLYQLNTIPGRTKDGIENYLAPFDGDVVAPDSWENMNDYQLCYWYCLEIERRQNKYADFVRQAGSKVCYMRFEELIDIRGALRKLRKELELPPLSILGRIKLLYKLIRPIRLNQKVEMKSRQLPSGMDFDKYELEVREAMVKASSLSK